MTDSQRDSTALNPPLILADEPTGKLDSATDEEILAIFRRLVDEQACWRIRPSVLIGAPIAVDWQAATCDA